MTVDRRMGRCLCQAGAVEIRLISPGRLGRVILIPQNEYNCADRLETRALAQECDGYLDRPVLHRSVPRAGCACDPTRSRTDPAVRSNFIMLLTFY
jgi:hypothetical protein